EILWYTEVHDARRELKVMSTGHEAIRDQWKFEVSELRQECCLYSRELKEASAYIQKQEEMAVHFENQACFSQLQLDTIPKWRP
ncbi:MAG: hypothetical protein ACKPKO_19620, partial [Candidatus Fonsibacter sp.]